MPFVKWNKSLLHLHVVTVFVQIQRSQTTEGKGQGECKAFYLYPFVVKVEMWVELHVHILQQCFQIRALGEQRCWRDCIQKDMTKVWAWNLWDSTILTTVVAGGVSSLCKHQRNLGFVWVIGLYLWKMYGTFCGARYLFLGDHYLWCTNTACPRQLLWINVNKKSS